MLFVPLLVLIVLLVVGFKFGELSLGQVGWILLLLLLSALALRLLGWPPLIWLTVVCLVDVVLLIKLVYAR